MRSFRTLEKLARFFSYAAMAVGVLAGSASAYAAAPCYNNCPPCYNYGTPGMSGAQGAPTVADPNAPADPNATAQQPQADADANLNLAPQNSNFQVAASGEGSNVGHIGRADSVNRLNIFDSQSALPANRVWYGFQYVDGFRADNTTPVSQNMALHRFGAEVMITCTSSISFMTQYADVAGGDFPVVDSWSNPQLMAKQIIYQDCDLILSATLGVQIPIGGIDAGEVRENTVRLAPGVLWYYNTTDEIFNYGGFQYGAPLASGRQVDTFDWSFGTGYWLYQSCCCCDWLQKVSLQHEIFGKHVIGDRGTLYAPGGPGFVLTEDRTAVDMTFGASAFLCNGVRASAGYSMPISGGYARRNEVILTVGYYF